MAKRFFIQEHHKILTEELAYILGAIKGDGWFRPYSVNLAVTDKDFALAYKKAVEKQFGVEKKMYRYKMKNKKWKDKYVIVIGSCEVSQFIKDFNLNKILKASKPVRCAFLRGIYDAEGSPISGRINRIMFPNTDKFLIDFVSKLLTGLNIKYKTYSHTDKRISRNKQIYKLYIQKRESIINFKKNIGFNIRRKQKKLNSIPSIVYDKKFRDEFGRFNNLANRDTKRYKYRRRWGDVNGVMSKGGNSIGTSNFALQENSEVEKPLL